MSRHLKELIALAENDKTIDSYNPKIEAENQKVERVKQRLDEKKALQEALKLEIQSNETKVVSFEEQIKLLSEQLTDNAKKAKEITTEKEMKALSLEESIAKDKLSFANEEIERLQGINETKQVRFEEMAGEIEALETKLQKVSMEVRREIELIEKSKIELFAAREEISRELDPKVLAFYEKIRAWAGNTAVVPVKKQACYGCFMKMNDKTYSEVIKADEIVNCPHCGRILYKERAEVVAEEA
jgi:predicted  nucleic acid-binding Zn-ribbon protein